MSTKKMKLLLDTHVLIWALSDPKKLKTSTINIINDYDNIIMVSAVTLWELEIKRSIGKIELPINFNSQIQNLGYKILDINKEHVSHLTNLPLIHRDPFDRMLIAQSLIEKAQLVTKDVEIMKYSLSIIEA